MKPHICILTVGFGFGGAERLIFDIVTSLKEYRFTIVGLKKTGILMEKLKKTGNQVYCLGGESTFDFRVLERCYYLMKRIKPDIIHTHLIKANWIGRIVGKKLGIPVISSIHNVYTFMNPLERKIERMTARFSLNIACSKKVMELNNKLIGNLYLDYIYNGIDTRNFKNPAGKPEKIVTVSRLLIKQKRVDVLLKGFEKVLKRFPEATLTIVGDGPDRAYLQNFATQLNINSRVNFTGYMPVNMDFLSRFGVFVLISEYEGLPYSVLEAIASGLVVIASNKGGIPEVIKDQKTGLLIETNTPKELTEKILYCLENLQNLQTMVKNAQNLLKTQFSLSKILNLWREIYNTNLKKHYSTAYKSKQ